jgi:predicted nucleic acid-binding protein
MPGRAVRRRPAAEARDVPGYPGLLCVHNAAEPHHLVAKALFKRHRNKLTTSYVLAELVTLAFVRGMARSPTLTFVLKLIESRTVTVVWVDQPLHLAAMELLGQRADKSYSLCDAVSFVLMKQRNRVEALTTDHHFEQEGFHRLLQG